MKVKRVTVISIFLLLASCKVQQSALSAQDSTLDLDCDKYLAEMDELMNPKRGIFGIIKKSIKSRKSHSGAADESEPQQAAARNNGDSGKTQEEEDFLDKEAVINSPEYRRAEKNYWECIARKYGSSDAAPKASGRLGHCDSSVQPYDILNYNCHSAANQSVRDEPKTTGIVSCNGDAPLEGSPEHHTFNYRVEGDLIVYYNWSKTCKAPKNSVPPNLSDPAHRECAETFCGSQYRDQEYQTPDRQGSRYPPKAFEPGTLVEEPGPLYCAQTSQNKANCDACCQYRGKYWDLAHANLRPTDRTFISFMSQCYEECSAKFR